jgi:hypothetical protein
MGFFKKSSAVTEINYKIADLNKKISELETNHKKAMISVFSRLTALLTKVDNLHKDPWDSSESGDNE